MAQTDFLFSDEEYLQLVDHLLGRGARFVPDISYSRQQYVELTSLHDVLTAAKETKLFFVIHDTFIRCPLELRQRRSVADAYYIMPRNGGPALDLYFTGKLPPADTCIPNGFIGCYPSFWDIAHQRNEEIPLDLKKVYQEARKFIQKSSRLVKPGKRRFYCGQKAIALGHCVAGKPGGKPG